LWTDGIIHYFNDGTVTFAEGGSVVDLVEYIGPFRYSSQRAPVSRPAETESTTAVAGGVNDDPGRIIYELEQRLAAETKRTEQAQRYISDANEAINEKTAEIARLQTDWKTEFTAAQQLRSENEWLKEEIERLKAELRGYAAESHRQLRTLQASHDSATATLRAEQRGAQAAYLAAIKAFLEASR
jgi:chromosome segregation ATPase